MASRITELFQAWRAASLGDREIVEGIVAPERAPARAPGAAGAPAPPDDDARALRAWDADGGAHYWDRFGGAPWLVLVREQAPPRERWWRHALLLALTLVTTTAGGAALAGHPVTWPHPAFASLRAGLAFSLPLAAILLAHESGHYVTARRYKVNVSPPYFIPFPAALNLLGTLGAFIRIRSPIFDRRTLFDVGVAGPIAGMVVALPVLVIGLALSHAAAIPAPPMAHQVIAVDGALYFLGDSLLVLAVRAALGFTGTVHLHPMAVAGWVGVLVTALNLLPLAQFDGGHIAYAMNRRAQRIGSAYVWVALLALGAIWGGWWVWAVLALVVGRGRLTHPDVLSPARPLDRRRLLVGWIALAIFVLTFAPVPIAG
jgi:membrane-associated protease RseP (regulator of RpoE activity)